MDLTFILYADKNNKNRLYFSIQRDIVYSEVRELNLLRRRFSQYGGYSAWQVIVVP
jgi:hypothetical protein